jgi:hypothetical protein
LSSAWNIFSAPDSLAPALAEPDAPVPADPEVVALGVVLVPSELEALSLSPAAHRGIAKAAAIDAAITVFIFIAVSFVVYVWCC